jgi:hypothetical protein
MSYAIQHTAIGEFPFWYHLESAKTLEAATRRAYNYAMDHGGYVCVKDETGKTVFGTDPVELDRAISNGINKSFPRETARRKGCCA